MLVVRSRKKIEKGGKSLRLRTETCLLGSAEKRREVKEEIQKDHCSNEAKKRSLRSDGISKPSKKKNSVARFFSLLIVGTGALSLKEKRES